ncbi:MAG: 4-(cytidine 5'-diphospho)-2-C-methyl-D-erythritol kinase [Armatimonadota bacterium]
MPAFAKINLTLDVGPRRDDGYHDIDSIVAKISAHDEITVSLRPGSGNVRLIVKDKRPDALAFPPLPKGADNLAHQAAQRALDTWMADTAIDVWVTLAKRIPVESGLGAGSSDAAAVLRLLAEAAGRTPEEAMALGAELGSDVNAFLIDGPVRMRGRGEIVEPMAGVPRLHGVVVRPVSGVSTAAAYRELDQTERTPGARTLGWLSSTDPADFPYGNDFQSPIAAMSPEVGEAIERLTAEGASPVLLCGSGSAVFGGTAGPVEAVGLVTRLARHFPWIKKVETLP